MITVSVKKLRHYWPVYLLILVPLAMVLLFNYYPIFNGFVHIFYRWNGDNIEEFIGSVFEAKAVYEKPTMIIAHTIPGKGVDFMEQKFEWHGKPPSKEEKNEALKQLRSMGGKIKEW